MTKGLTSQEAEKKLAEFGLNILPEEKQPSDFETFLAQLKNPLISILLLAAGVTFFLKEFSDALVILLAVLVNTILGFYQERKANRALLALKKILTPRAVVWRDGRRQILEAKRLVPDDLVFLNAGDKVPADGLLTESARLWLNEAIITGESNAVGKNRGDEVLTGTTVLAGRGVFQVRKTGQQTKIGGLAEKLGELETEKTPLERRLNELARQLAIFVLVSAFFIFLIGVFLGQDLPTMFTTAVALAVAAIPEGLVISLTAILAIGMQRILKKKGLVRHLLAAETLGTVTVIATDKTGTLTEGTMKVVKTDFTDLKPALETCVLANNLADPLEIALWEYVQAQDHFDPQKLSETKQRVDELPFSPEKKLAAYLYQDRLVVSGAPEVILAKSANLTKNWEEEIAKWGEEGLRIVALAEKETQTLKKIKEEDLQNMKFLGLVGFTDPVRETVKEALAETREAGIVVKVITGDFRATAEVVLKKLGMTLLPEQIIEGKELEALSNEELIRRIDRLVLFARTTPSQKYKIVQALKTKGEIVAIIGDGVNDALALKTADIGVVVGDASEVAKETADLVLLDSNFGTILSAIEEGRLILVNLKKIILYLLSGAFSELVLIFGAMVAALPLPLTASQILWINLLTDGLPNLALIIEPKEKNLLKRPPPKANLALLDSPTKNLIILISLISGLASLALFLSFWQKTGDLVLARSVAFTALGMYSLLYVFSIRNLVQPFWRSGFWQNKPLLLACLIGFFVQLAALYTPLFQKILRVSPLGIFEWGAILITSALVILIIEMVKLSLAKNEKN